MSGRKKAGHARSSRRRIAEACGNFPAIDERAARVMRAAERVSLNSTRAELRRRDLFDETQLDVVDRWYRKHLFLMGYFPHVGVLAPADQVGEFWHTHILETEKYARDCMAICGRPLHHSFEPGPGTEDYEEAVRTWKGLIFGIVGRQPPDWFTYTGETR